jgi:hypothetical protein
MIDLTQLLWNMTAPSLSTETENDVGLRSYVIRKREFW